MLSRLHPVEEVEQALAGEPGIEVGEDDGDIGVAMGGTLGYRNGHAELECEVAWWDGVGVRATRLRPDQAMDGCGIATVWGVRDGHFVN